MTHKLGMHWLRYHQDGRDLEHIERMQYPSIKPFQWMWNNAGFCADLLTVLPGDSYILARDHPLSEQKAEMWHDPVGTGQRHADEWAEKVRSRQYHLPIDRTFFLGINEPDATNGDRSAIDRYNTTYLTRLQQHGLRGGAFNFSTGHPRTVDGTPNTPADYSVFESSHAAMVRGHHIAVAHIYGTTAVPLAPGHYDRLTACNWTDVEWVIGEFGIDEHVIGGGEHIGFHGGLEGRLGEYCQWLDTAIMGIEAIFPYIHSYEPFTFDFSHPWGSFDVRVIREALEAYDWQHGKGGSVTEPDERPVDIYLPGIGTGSSQGASMGIIDPLVGQTLIEVESGGRAFGPDDKPLIRFENHIFKGKLGNDALYYRHFQHGSPVWTGHKWRRGEGDPWREVHTDNQADEYAVFQLALSLSRQAAYESISMGLGQIMGFNARRVGFPSAEAMFANFHNEAMQVLGFINFFLSDPQLAQAVQSKDWRTIARLYNGPGNVDSVAPLLESTYNQLLGG